MVDYRRTSINLPIYLLKDAQAYAVEYDLTLTQLLLEGLSKRIEEKPQTKKTLMDLAGLVHIGGKEPPSRQEMYDTYLEEKMGR